MTDNYYKDICPAVLSDGRYLQDFRASATREQRMKRINDIDNENDFRIFLQTNASIIMDEQLKMLKDNYSCFTTPCIHDYPSRVSVSQMYEEMDRYTNNVQMKCNNGFDYRLGK